MGAVGSLNQSIFSGNGCSVDGNDSKKHRGDLIIYLSGILLESSKLYSKFYKRSSAYPLIELKRPFDLNLLRESSRS